MGKRLVTRTPPGSTDGTKGCIMRSWIAASFILLSFVCILSTAKSAPDPRFSQTLPPPSLFVALPGEVVVVVPSTTPSRRSATFPTPLSPLVAAQTRPLVSLRPTPSTIGEVHTIGVKVVASASAPASSTGVTVGPTHNALFAASGNDVLE